jgi:leader peptidase (prepilin peptidase)/N-methyltransferase
MTPFLVTYLTLLAFFFGACVGSFLNVCIYRIPREESVVAPRSHCPNCNKLIVWYDNIPLVSYLVLKAKCRNCGVGITPRYFLVELLAAVLFLAVWNKYGFSAATPHYELIPIYWLVISGLILGTFVDFEHMILPDRVTIGGMIAGVGLSLLAPSMHAVHTPWLSLKLSLLGLAVGFGSLYGVGEIGRLIFKKDAMGFGDVKLMGAIGAFFGWPAVLFTIMTSSIFGSLVGVYLIVAKKYAWQSRIPYGPYIALACLVWMLGGNEWWKTYWSWLTNVR